MLRLMDCEVIDADEIAREGQDFHWWLYFRVYQKI